ncbi:MAG: hypothetical protein MI919_37630 [Holophagales bacterium]|nr:hypothetical protein [Holophagales bacterium]
MTKSQLLQEIERLPSDELEEIAARIAVLRRTRSPEYAKEIRRRREDNDPASWTSLEELKSLASSRDIR